MAATPYAKSEDTNLIANGTTIAGALGKFMSIQPHLLLPNGIRCYVMRLMGF